MRVKLRDKIFNETEGKSEALCASYTKLILNELENKIQRGITYDSMVDGILNLLFTEYRDEVVKIMNKYNYNREEIARTLIYNLCNQRKDIDVEYLKRVQLFFKNLSFAKQDKTYIIKSEVGTLSFQRFTDCMDDQVISCLIQSGRFKQRCHFATEVFAGVFPDSTIITSLMPGRFGGQFYHSYFQVKDNMIVDVASNGVFEKNGYYQYFSPQEVISYPSIELDNRYNALKEKSTDAKVLQLALEEMKNKR